MSGNSTRTIESERMSMADFNQQVITEFHENNGVVGGMFEGMPILLLHHVGVKSGTWRIAPLAYLADAGRYVIFASKAGAPKHPSWFHNLKDHPQTKIEVGADVIDVVATVADSEERDRLYKLQVDVNPQFAEYETKTSRVIPVVILTPAG
jgi:deazaflavin-dependent oxidoreductase (nitroreductase family)